LDKLTNELIVNSSKENFDLLLEFITTAACENNAEAKPLWKTKPNPGAIIYYQSQGERRRGVVPHAVQPTDAARGICVGTYYIWAERNNKVTSDKNLIYEIDLNYPEVVVTEFNPNE
jgi:hypothetical protein